MMNRDILRIIFRYIPIQEIEKNVCRVNKFFYKISEDPYLWKLLLEKEFPNYKDFLFYGSYKSAYRFLYFLKIWEKNAYFSHSKSFCFCDSSLKKLPKEIETFTFLQNLTIHNNEFIEIPKEIGNLTLLIELDISHNGLKEIPREIGQLIHLEQLNLSSNQLENIPKEIGQLIHLEQLNLSSNQLESIPKEIGNLTSLKTLFVYYNKIVTLPVEMGNLIQLEHFNCSHNKITKIPTQLVKRCLYSSSYLSREAIDKLTDQLVYKKSKYITIKKLGMVKRFSNEKRDGFLADCLNTYGSDVYYNVYGQVMTPTWAK